MFSKMNSNVRSVLKNIECSPKVHKSVVALLMSLIGTAHGAAEEDAVTHEENIAGFYPTVVIHEGWKTVSGHAFLDSPASNQLVLRPGVHTQVLSGSYWRQFAGFRSALCDYGCKYTKLGMMPGVIANRLDLFQTEGAQPCSVAELMDAINECQYYCMKTADADCNYPNPHLSQEDAWLSAENGKQKGKLEKLKERWIHFLRRMCGACEPKNVHILIIREFRENGVVYKATWGCALVAHQKNNWIQRQSELETFDGPLSDFDEEFPHLSLDVCIDPALGEDPTTNKMIDVGTGKITIIDAITGREEGQVAYHKVAARIYDPEYVGNTKTFDVWSKDREEFDTIMTQVLQDLMAHKNVSENLKIQVQLLPARCTGGARRGNNIVKLREIFERAEYQRPSVVRIEEEACFCAAQGKKMTQKYFAHYSILREIIFDFHNGNECGKGTAEGGIEAFDYISFLKEATELASFEDLAENRFLMAIVQQFKLDEAFKSFYELGAEERIEFSNELMEIREGLMGELESDAMPEEFIKEGMMPVYGDKTLGWNNVDRFEDFRDNYVISGRRRRLVHTTYRKQPTMKGLMALIENQRRH